MSPTAFVGHRAHSATLLIAVLVVIACTACEVSGDTQGGVSSSEDGAAVTSTEASTEHTVRLYIEVSSVSEIGPPHVSVVDDAGGVVVDVEMEGRNEPDRQPFFETEVLLPAGHYSARLSGWAEERTSGTSGCEWRGSTAFDVPSNGAVELDAGQVCA